MQELAAGGKIQQLEEQEKELSVTLARLRTKIDLKTSAVQEAEKQVIQSVTTVQEVSSSEATCIELVSDHTRARV